MSDFWKEARKAANLTQKQVSKELNYDSSQFVSNWERKKCDPPPIALPKLCKLYKLEKSTVVDYFTEKERLRIKKALKC